MHNFFTFLSAYSVKVEAAAMEDDIFSSLLQTADSPAATTVSGDLLSVCVSRSNASSWAVLCAELFENKLAVCKRSKQSGQTYVSLFISSERSEFHQHRVPKFHGLPVSEFVLSLTMGASPSPSVPSSLQYRPLIQLITPASSQLPPGNGSERIETELFLQLFGPDCSQADGAVLLVCGANGHILYCNLRNIDEMFVKGQLSKGRTLSSPSGREFFKPLYSLDQPVVSVHTAAFSKRREQLDPLLYVDDDSHTAIDSTPNSVIFIGQRGKVALCHAAATLEGTEPRAVAKFIEYNVPGPVLSSRLIPDQCLVYNSPTNFHRVCLRKACFREVEENAPQLQLRRCPLLIPEASLKFPERVEGSISPSVLVDCQFTDADDVKEGEAICEEIGLTLVGLKGGVRSSKIKVCTKEGVSRDPDLVAMEIKQCLNSIQATSEEVSLTSSKIAKINENLAELNQVLTLLCAVKCQQEGVLCNYGGSRFPFECTVSAGFAEVGVCEREMCIDVRLLYHEKRALGSGWSLLIQVSPSSHMTHAEHLHSRLGRELRQERGVVEGGALTTPTTLSRSVSLAGFREGNVLEEKVSVSLTSGRSPCFAVSCYLHYDASNIASVLDDPSGNCSSCDRLVTVLLVSRLVDALDFTCLSSDVPRRLHLPLDLATSCLDSKRHLTSDNVSQSLMHSIQLPITMTLQSLGNSDSDAYRQLAGMLLPHVPGAEEMLRNDVEIGLTSYDGSAVALTLLRGRSWDREGSASSSECGLSLSIKSSLKSGLAELVRCVRSRLDNQRRNTTSPTKDELFKREADLKGISREATSLLDDVIALEKFRGEPLVLARRAELLTKTFSLYGRLRELPQD